MLRCPSCIIVCGCDVDAIVVKMMMRGFLVVSLCLMAVCVYVPRRDVHSNPVTVLIS